jgi:hypothetical protein
VRVYGRTACACVGACPCVYVYMSARVKPKCKRAMRGRATVAASVPNITFATAFEQSGAALALQSVGRGGGPNTSRGGAPDTSGANLGI